MGVKVWVYSDFQSGQFYMLDGESFGGCGPIEISPDLHEQIREAEKAFDWAQTTLETLEYGWKYPDDDPEMDCG